MSLIEVTEGYCDLSTKDLSTTLNGIRLAEVGHTMKDWAECGFILEVTRQYVCKVLLEDDCLHSVQMQSADGKVVLDEVDANDIEALSKEYERKGTPLNITQWHTLADVKKRKKDTD